MTIDLSQHEAGSSYDGHYKRDLAELQDRLARIQTAHIVHGRSGDRDVRGLGRGGEGWGDPAADGRVGPALL